MKLLITGASGFAGNVLLDQFSLQYPQARITVLMLPGDPGETRIRGKVKGKPSIASIPAQQLSKRTS